MEKHNGWSNRSTWVIALWCNCTGMSAQEMREFLEEQFDDIKSPILRDIIAPELASINWQEIEQTSVPL